jgi:hypothetical protein
MNEQSYKMADDFLMGRLQGKMQFNADGTIEYEGKIMGDRFYTQQAKATTKTTSTGVKKASKAELATQLKTWVSADLSGLLQPDLELLLDYFLAGASRLPSHAMPTGRLKAPWVACLSTLIPVQVDWARLTVANMRAVYESIIPVE